MIDYADPNIFRPEKDIKIYDSEKQNSVKIRCPHCQCVGTFESAIGKRFTYTKELTSGNSYANAYIENDIRQCPNPRCQSVVFTVTEYNSSTKEEKVICFPPEMLDFNPDKLPEELLRTLKEALICHSQGAFRASAMMVRRLLEELCHDCGVQGRTLHDRLKALRTHITLSEDLFDAMDELKALGNDAAHIEAKAYKSIEKDESELSIELAQEILKARYQHKHLVERLRKKKVSRDDI